MDGLRTSSFSRRAVLHGAGVGAVGLAGAALLGCGGGGGQTGGEPGAGGQTVAGATRGEGLPRVAPEVKGTIKPGGIWNTASTGTPKQFDMHTALASTIWHYISGRPLEPHPITNEILPNYFTSWEVADPNGLTLMFKVHPKLYVHNVPPFNGRQFTAEDMAWNLERIGGLYAEREKIPLSSFQRASMVANITKAEAVDPLTVKVTLSRPNSAFFNGLMENRVPVMTREMADIGFKDPMKMAGPGPWQVTEWVTDQKLSFKKHPRFSAFRPNEPYFDGYQTTVVPDSGSIQAAFISGQIQTVSTPSPENIQTVRRGRPDANLYTTVDQNWQHIRPGMKYAPFQDYRVRKALFLAGDYKDMADGFYGDGWAYQAALNPMYPEAWGPDKVKALPGYNPDTKVQDRAEGNRLLEAAGYPKGKGLDFEIMVQNPSENNKENATRFQNHLQTTFPDIKVNLKLMPDSASFSVPQAAGDFQILSYTITCVPDAVLEFVSQYHSKGSRNYGKFNEPALDALMDKAIVELNREARTKMLDEAQRKFMDEWLPMYVLYAQPLKVMVQSNVGGYDKTWGITYGYGGLLQAHKWYYVDK